MREDFSGQTVKLNKDIMEPSMGVIQEGTEYHVEGYWDDVTGGSWMHANGNVAALNYALRAGHAGLPADDDVLYGKIGALGVLIHVSEIDAN